MSELKCLGHPSFRTTPPPQKCFPENVGDGRRGRGGRRFRPKNIFQTFFGIIRTLKIRFSELFGPQFFTVFLNIQHVLQFQHFGGLLKKLGPLSWLFFGGVTLLTPVVTVLSKTLFSFDMPFTVCIAYYLSIILTVTDRISSEFSHFAWQEEPSRKKALHAELL
jgi:hypothetical protein